MLKWVLLLEPMLLMLLLSCYPAWTSNFAELHLVGAVDRDKRGGIMSEKCVDTFS